MTYSLVLVKTVFSLLTIYCLFAIVKIRRLYKNGCEENAIMLEVSVCFSIMALVILLIFLIYSKTL